MYCRPEAAEDDRGCASACSDCDRKHEFNLNHYSILGQNQWIALFLRTGFNIDFFNSFKFNINGKNPQTDEPYTAEEHFYIVMLTKQRPLDIK